MKIGVVFLVTLCAHCSDLGYRQAVAWAIAEGLSELPGIGTDLYESDFRSRSMHVVNSLRYHMDPIKAELIDASKIVDDWAKAGQLIYSFTEIMNNEEFYSSRLLSSLDQLIAQYQSFANEVDDLTRITFPIRQTLDMLETVRGLLARAADEPEEFVRAIWRFHQEMAKLLSESLTPVIRVPNLVPNLSPHADENVNLAMVQVGRNLSSEKQCLDEIWGYFKEQKKLLIQSFENDAFSPYHHSDARNHVRDNFLVGDSCSDEQKNRYLPRLVEVYMQYYGILVDRMSLLGFLHK